MSIKIITQSHLFGKVNGIHVDDMYDIYKRKEQLAIHKIMTFHIYQKSQQ